MTTRDTILEAALERFARYGYLGTSIQQIADAVGTSKSSVLYHFDSKESLLEAAMAPALDALESLLQQVPTSDQHHAFSRDDLVSLVTVFVDLLQAHARAVTIFVSQRGALLDVPVIGRANALVNRMAEVLIAEASATPEVMRLSIGLAGAAFLIGEAERDDVPEFDRELKRRVLIDTIVDLCPPLPAEHDPAATVAANTAGAASATTEGKDA
ncbi:TetR/AcrR family transcriptional regulator [Agrococcus sp. Marseille-P2731]|uniref:TetR/AcrR family transcriptional regulator n=1 Tax=Agrococcus sp. Marseille-P2731 TaxID=1841862 RepID=UPI00093114DA|nr:TetR/AcrR family transcriptional regulator [Agrococcus sp. Marseille-P2731]